jgi:hypothetical protein
MITIVSPILKQDRYPTSQGSYCTARLNGSSDNPLDLLTSKKRKIDDLEKSKEEKKRQLPIREDHGLYLPPFTLCNNLLNSMRYTSRESAVNNIFGAHDHPQPTLNHITIHFKTRLNHRDGSNIHSVDDHPTTIDYYQITNGQVEQRITELEIKERISTGRQNQTQL